ncbi:Outer membrane receptor for ferrienterochelin and colicins [Bacteroides thetaiotaomicron]|nr:Outer membrane receptor for ferrienterochelin and colicins [Bacteroides thetaiotaomicron]
MYHAVVPLFNGYGAARKVVVKGVVTDEAKEPLIGVNVTVKDMPGLGSITDMNGHYSITMEPYRQLVFTYIGYESKEVMVKEQRTINVVMKESVTRAVDEVVITGTGVQRKTNTDRCYYNGRCW